MSIDATDENFLRFAKAGDVEAVDLFLDAGFSPDICDSARVAAIALAAKAGQKEVARLLLARGASPEPLLNRVPSPKDAWDKLTASSGVLSFVSGLLIAAVGGYFTYSYNQRQIDLNRTQAEHDSATKEQANKILELEAVQKLIPTLTAQDEKGKAAALIAIQDLAHPELAADLAVLFKGQGSVQYLQEAASSGTPTTKQAAVHALTTIASTGTPADSTLAKKALSTVFENTRASVVQVLASNSDGIFVGSGIVVTSDGYVLTSAHLLTEPHSTIMLSIKTSENRVLSAQIVSYNNSLDLAILKVPGISLAPLRLSGGPVAIGSEVIGIGYAGGQEESAFVGAVTAVDNQHIFFNANISSGVAGGPILDNTGSVIGLMDQRTAEVAIAVRSDVAISYLGKNGVNLSTSSR